MDFYTVLDQAVDLLRQRGRVTYRALEIQFKLADDQLEALKDELLYAHPQVVDDAGRGLAGPAPQGAPTADAAPAPAEDRSTVVHPAIPGRADPHLPHRPGRRAQAGHSAVCRP